ncbi:MAG: alpha/beta fold hydrolase [Armatimonadota bacterium]
MTVTVAMAGVPVAAQPTSAPSPELSRLAQEFVEFMVREDFASAVRRFTDSIQREVTPQGLGEAWRSLLTQFGRFQRQVGTRSEQISGYVIVIVTCQFERGLIDVRITFDGERRIAGLYFAAGQGPAEFRPPPYAEPSRFTERDVTIGTGEWALPGTLSVPRDGGPHPAIVIVHGSGPGDRDGTHGPNKIYRDLAWGLASRSVAVLRYDKRTRIHAARIAQVIDTFTVNHETVDDAVAAVAVLRGIAGIDARRIFVLGHSLGGMMAPRIGQRDPGTAGFVILAGATTPMEDAILAQTIYLASLDGPISSDAQRQIDELRRQVARVKDPNLTPATPRTELPLGTPASYWLDLRGYNPAVVALEQNRPMLILQGARDYQVTLEDYEGWRRQLGSRPNVTFKLYPSLNHAFMAGEGKSTPLEYARIGHVTREVVEDIAAWIMGRR